MERSKWPWLACIVAGIWLAFSPLVLGYGRVLPTLVLGRVVMPTVVWHDVVVGILIAGISWGLLNGSVPERGGWANLVAGFWLIVSPLVLAGFDTAWIVANHLVVGLLVAGLAMTRLYLLKKSLVRPPTFASTMPDRDDRRPPPNEI